jgi:asparagine synthase (glutamine-hydrolysing)
MCGFAGFLGGEWQEGEAGAKALLRRMNDTLINRGPDSEGYWVDGEAGIALGHRRLAILDLSAAGAQPMESACKRYMLAFNGEIYNHLRLREELQRNGPRQMFRGTSDTETLLAGFTFWGVRPTIERCVGMFAFALWDRHTRTLTLGRDRLGEKPLYYGWQGQGDQRALLFGSELKALRVHPAFSADIDRGALCLLMRHNCVPSPYSIYTAIHKLPPGCLLDISLSNPDGVATRYWSAITVAEQGLAARGAHAEPEQLEEIERLLKEAVRQQMIADVPLGAFLSGGVDSSLIVALMQSQSAQPVKTFTIGYGESRYNEAVHAGAVARHLGTAHTELYVSPAQAMAVIRRLPAIYCEPFSDSSQIPTLLVSELARQHVTVALTGDAGDELFGGYNRHIMTQRVWPKLSRLPIGIRRLASHVLAYTSIGGLSSAVGALQELLPASRRHAYVRDKLQKVADVLACDSVDALYLKLVSHWDKPSNMVLNGQEPPTLLAGKPLAPRGLSDVETMMLLDTLTYLPDDNLAKVDRASMSVSLETRVPLLDHRVVECAWRMPISMKLNGREGKWALRRILDRYVPRTLVQRPKMGFSVPIADWLRGPLREWAEALLDAARLSREGYLDAEPIRQRWKEHLAGRRNWQYPLWDVLMFQAWLERHVAP